MVTYGRLLGLFAVSILVVTALLSSAAAGGTARSGATSALFVSAMGSDGGSCSKAQPCKTIGRALNVATAGTTIQVGPSKYKEQVDVSKKVRLVGIGKPIIDATGLSNGFVVSGDAAEGTVIEGFVVRGASNEGILIKKTADVTIRNNVISYNNRGLFTVTPSGACAPQGQVPGDCGSGLHLLSTANVNVLSNIIRNNVGGILVTDELGPASNNLISGNLVLNNLYSSGIRLSGLATSASTTDGRDIGAGGVFSNVIIQNVLDGNGLLGMGGGVLLEATADGTAVYDNNVARNTAAGNGLAGVTLRRASAAADTNDNQIIGNVLAHNGLRGGPSGPGDSIAGVTQTVGIVLHNVSGSVAGVAVSGNTIIGSSVGIWTLRVPGVSAGSNAFSSVATPVISK